MDEKKSKIWTGAAAICLNDQMEVLMVRARGSDQWAVPSGGTEPGESLEDCCIREMKEQTGYHVQIKQRLFVKKATVKAYQMEISYYEAEVLGKRDEFLDLDGIIEEAEWKPILGIHELNLMYPEDVRYIVQLAAEKYPVVEQLKVKLLLNL